MVRIFRLPDGRALAYAEWGDLDGRPVLCFHGMPASRLFIPRFRTGGGRARTSVVIAASGQRAWADRPATGPRRRRLAAGDVIALADALGLERFGVQDRMVGRDPVRVRVCCADQERLAAASAATSAAAMRYLIAKVRALRDSLLDDDDRRSSTHCRRVAMLPRGARDDARRRIRGVASRNARSNSSRSRGRPRRRRVPRRLGGAGELGWAGSIPRGPCVRGPRRSRHSTSPRSRRGASGSRTSRSRPLWAGANGQGSRRPTGCAWSPTRSRRSSSRSARRRPRRHR